ncbi:MAG: hypothetical protein U0L23_06795 [Lachnospiraceae bacterium]|nr:hypothetical protein [Lachnospiraceae bacterium]
MTKSKDYLTLITIALLIITSVAGIMSINFTKSYEIINQYGHTVQMYGYGIYAHDTYFLAPISIGTDICILFVVVPMFIFAYANYVKKGDDISKLKLVSIYAGAFYYAASLAFGLTYNRLFLVYVALFACSLFGMFTHICSIKLDKKCVPTKGLKVFLILSGIALIVAWLPDVIPSAIKGGTLSLIGVYTTNITYVLDMGIISPICFVTIYLMKKKNIIGTLLLAILLKMCMIVGIMMFPQTICQVVSGCDMPIPALITKSLSFVVLGGFALYFNQKLFLEIKE